MTADLVKKYDSSSEEYSRAFKVFLEHTNQKKKMHEWLQKIIQKLPKKDVFIDAGAGNGEVTTIYSPLFKKTIAIEPNPFLWKQLRQAAPQSTVIHQSISNAELTTLGDLVLCSHVFYYIPQNLWLENLEHLASWVSATGKVIAVLQNHKTDCMTMLEYFFNQRYDLNFLAEEFKKKYLNHYRLRLDTDAAFIETNDFNEAYIIAEFMLNLISFKHIPKRTELEDYIELKFKTPEGKYHFSCDQDFLQIERI